MIMVQEFIMTQLKLNESADETMTQHLQFAPRHRLHHSAMNQRRWLYAGSLALNNMNNMKVQHERIDLKRLFFLLKLLFIIRLQTAMIYKIHSAMKNCYF